VEAMSGLAYLRQNNTNGHLYINFIHTKYLVRTLFHPTRELNSIQEDEETHHTHQGEKGNGLHTQTARRSNCTPKHKGVRKKNSRYEILCNSRQYIIVD
jgi:hypothetical protein